jgi:hypothetical protein
MEWITSDGEGETLGQANESAFLDWQRQPDVTGWLFDHALIMSGDHGEAIHWLVYDRDDEVLYVAPRDQAEKIVKQQRISPQ